MSYNTPIKFALKNNSIVYIDDVERGLDCDCLCLGCGSMLVAKKGEKNTHFFSHASRKDGDQFCNESTLHAVAKDIIASEGVVFIPDQDKLYKRADLFNHVSLEQRKVSGGNAVTLDDVVLEFSQGKYRPDITAICGNEKLFIEIVVTHGVDSTKARMVRDDGIAMLAIYLDELDSCLDRKSLTQMVLKNAPREWIYSPAPELREQFEYLDYIEVKSTSHEVTVRSDMNLEVWDWDNLELPLDSSSAFPVISYGTYSTHMMAMDYAYQPIDNGQLVIVINIPDLVSRLNNFLKTSLTSLTRMFFSKKEI